MSTNILIIEDNPDLAALIQHTLQEHGYDTQIAPSGHDGLRKANQQHPDLIILDLHLPDLSGEEIIQELRRNHQTPVVILSADNSPPRKAELLNAGADDYLTKPCSHEELLARINMHLRRTKKQQPLRVGDLTVSPEEHRAWFGTMELRLSRREEEMLLLFARQPGRVFTRDELRGALWPDEPCKNTTIDTHISNLRLKVQEAGGRQVIRTVRGVGFGLSPTRVTGASPDRPDYQPK